MWVRGHNRSVSGPFSPKLSTALNQYGAGGPSVIGLIDGQLGMEFENLSLEGDVLSLKS